MVEIMKSPHYRDDVNLQIERDKVRGLLCCVIILVWEGKSRPLGNYVCYWRIILTWIFKNGVGVWGLH
jgi:hypothetical protein